MSTRWRFDCAVNADCAISCEFGAINKTYLGFLGHGCRDGCAGRSSGPPRCASGKCVVANDACNNRPAPAEVCVDANNPVLCQPGFTEVSIGDRFACSSDAECTSRCEYGAINKTAADYLEHRCKDGCASPQFAPKCVKGRCVSVGRDDGKPVAGCTNRPAPPFGCKAPK